MPYLKELNCSSKEFSEAEQLLMTAWTKDNVKNLRVERIFNINHNPTLINNHKSYEKLLEDELSTKEINKMQLFHGTHFECNFTTKSTARLCRKDCEGCSIVKQSFKMECVGKNHRPTKWQRLGHGIYFSPHASKCHFYAGTGAQALHKDSSRQVRGLFLVSVILGRTYKPSSIELQRTALPSGFHSSHGEAGKCELNYDEYVIFNEKACLPIRLYVYSYTSTTE